MDGYNVELATSHEKVTKKTNIATVVDTSIESLNPSLTTRSNFTREPKCPKRFILSALKRAYDEDEPGVGKL